MERILEGLKRAASINPRKKEPSPYGDVMERAIAWSVDLVGLYYVLRGVFDRVAMQVFNHADPATIDQVKRANFAQVWHDTQAATEAGSTLAVLQSPALHLYLTEITAEFLLIGLLVVGAQCVFGNTPGKWLLGLRVVRRHSFEPVAKWRYLLRFVAYIPAVAPLMLGVLWCHFNKERRGWHDMIAGTVVITLRPEGWYWGKLKQGFRWVKAKLISK